MLLVALLTSGCVSPKLLQLRLVPRCADGFPPQLLTDRRCPPDSLCGFSCLPDRWAAKDLTE